MSIETKGALWLAVLAALEQATGEEPDCDDEGMNEADAQQLAGWADDLEARCGVDVDEFRPALARYVRRRNQSLILREFPDFADALHLPSFFPMVCEPWHNDICPVYRYRIEGRRADLWIDYANPEARELDGKRYTLAVYATDPDDSDIDREELAVFESEEPANFAALAVALCNEDNAQAVKDAAAFVRILRKWLTPEEFAEMQARNSAEKLAGVCHSHDFCDANMAMHAAIGEPEDIDAALDRMNAAWNAARLALCGVDTNEV